jgi:hypothetical protein
MTHAGPESTRRPVLLAVIGFALSVALSAGYTTWSVQSGQDAQRHERAVQQRQGAVIEGKLCAALDRLYTEKPPAGNPVTNPSRAYLQDLHARFAEIRADLGCAR